MAKTMTIARVDGICAVCRNPWKRGEIIKQVQKGWGHIECPRTSAKAQAKRKAPDASRPQRRDVRRAQFYWIVDAGLAEPEDSPWPRSAYRARVRVCDAMTGDPSTCVVSVLDGWAMGREFVTSRATLEPIPRRQKSAQGKSAEEQYRLGFGARQRQAREEYRQKYPSQINDRVSGAKARYWAKQNAPDRDVSGPVKTGDPRRGSPGSLHGAGLWSSAQWGKGRRQRVIYHPKEDT